MTPKSLQSRLKIAKNAKFGSTEPANWAYFSFTNEEEIGGPLADSATAFPTESCNSCHQMFALYDHLFAQYYPVIRAANPDVFATLEAFDNEEMMQAVSAAMGELTESAEAASEEADEPFVDRAALEAIDAVNLIPIGAEEILPYLQDGGYAGWTSESEIHESVGPHGYVRSFINSILEESIDAGNEEHPIGSAMVKELYGEDAQTLIGWAAYLKTQSDSANGKGWYWYENISTIDNSELVADSNGDALCVSCHALSRIDYVLSRVPFE
ncbi:hypothetical protein KFU94_17340 [Chloroflexi bacterium TSY]|nr:hypothetical protein [Chloroflexi bacterium TSY]